MAAKMMKPKKDKKIFKSVSNKTNKKNSYTPRGGVRF